MRPSVIRIFPAFSRRFEGDVGTMYLDVKRLVTVGIGCLVDPVGLAVRLPFRHADGTAASAGAIATAWQRVKQEGDHTRSWRAAIPLNNGLSLTRADIDSLMLQRLAASEAWLRRTFPAWDSLPADAQLGIVSMAWAAGPDFTSKFPRFTAAARAGQWAVCADECKLREAGNPGVVPRNLADRWLFMAASVADIAGPQYASEVHWQDPSDHRQDPSDG